MCDLYNMWYGDMDRMICRRRYRHVHHLVLGELVLGAGEVLLELA